ncbi:MAG: ribonuclease Z [Candidatus Nanoarchaeia archaeon]|nr:ribonuclease Z [Candidatus Nanoarchaeia archaeon]MDD5587921.1 ribonuclease Z [Candidatus Nanoarchaeia archaeon]
MKIIFLGTAAMQPTKDRSLFSILINYNEESIMIDCGEGTQRQMKIAGLKPTKLTKILISHMHGDHLFGLPGLMQYLRANDYQKTLEIYGPSKLKEFLACAIKTGTIEENIKYNINEIKEGIICKSKDFSIKALKLDHTGICYGFQFIENDKRRIDLNYLKKFGLKQHPILKNLQQGKDIIWNGKKILASKATKLIKGKKIAFILDTKLCKNCYELAKDSDVLISEATYLDELKDRAEAYKHMTVKQVAEIAKKSNIQKLILTHFSQRYKDTKDLEKEAKKYFKKQVICAKDFLEIEI